MLFRLFLFFIPIMLYSQEFVWDSDSRVNMSEEKYEEIIKNYVDKKYPKKVQHYKKNLKKEQELKRTRQLQRQKEIDKNTVMLNGLMWQDNAQAKILKRNFSGANEYCKSLRLLEYDDWRLPSVDELKEIVDRYKRPTIDRKFANVASGAYWSSSVVASLYKYSWSVDFRNAKASYYNKKTQAYVRCVREK